MPRRKTAPTPESVSPLEPAKPARRRAPKAAQPAPVAPPEPADIPAPEAVDPEPEVFEADGPPLTTADLTAIYDAVFVPSDIEETDAVPYPEDVPDEPEPEPVGPFVFTQTFAESGRGLARDAWTQRCLTEVRASGHKPKRIKETATPPLGKPADEGTRLWKLEIEVV